MKTTMKINVKGVEMVIDFEGSLSEFVGVNKEIVRSIKETLDAIDERKGQLINLLDYAVERVGDSYKKFVVKEKEVKDFENIIKNEK